MKLQYAAIQDNSQFSPDRLCVFEAVQLIGSHNNLTTRSLPYNLTILQGCRWIQSILRYLLIALGFLN